MEKVCCKHLFRSVVHLFIFCLSALPGSDITQTRTPAVLRLLTQNVVLRIDFKKLTLTSGHTPPKSGHGLPGYSDRCIMCVSGKIMDLCVTNIHNKVREILLPGRNNEMEDCLAIRKISGESVGRSAS